jgi:hypothetical protein
MIDNTSVLKVCQLESCGKKFEKYRNQRYCSKECSEKANRIKLDLKRKLNNIKLRKSSSSGSSPREIPEKLLNEMNRIKWQTTKLSKLNKFYELFGTGQCCDICSTSFDEALDKYGVPLFIELKPDIRDHRVLDIHSWSRFCLKCWSNINLIKKEG